MYNVRIFPKGVIMKGIFLNIDINTVTFPFLSRVAAQETVTEADLYPFVDQYAGTQVTDLAFDIFCQISMTEYSF